MSDKEMDRLPERAAVKPQPGVGRSMAVRILVSGLATDVRRALGRLRRKPKR